MDDVHGVRDVAADDWGDYCSGDDEGERLRDEEQSTAAAVQKIFHAFPAQNVLERARLRDVRRLVRGQRRGVGLLFPKLERRFRLVRARLDVVFAHRHQFLFARHLVPLHSERLHARLSLHASQARLEDEVHAEHRRRLGRGVDFVRLEPRLDGAVGEPLGEQTQDYSALEHLVRHSRGERDGRVHPKRHASARIIQRLLLLIPRQRLEVPLERRLLANLPRRLLARLVHRLRARGPIDSHHQRVVNRRRRRERQADRRRAREIHRLAAPRSGAEIAKRARARGVRQTHRQRPFHPPHGHQERKILSHHRRLRRFRRRRVRAVGIRVSRRLAASRPRRRIPARARRRPSRRARLVIRLHRARARRARVVVARRRVVVVQRLAQDASQRVERPARRRRLSRLVVVALARRARAPARDAARASSASTRRRSGVARARARARASRAAP